jgi:hypothetical protein
MYTPFQQGLVQPLYVLPPIGGYKVSALLVVQAVVFARAVLVYGGGPRPGSHEQLFGQLLPVPSVPWQIAVVEPGPVWVMASAKAVPQL